jgi:hypothetical protein
VSVCVLGRAATLGRWAAGRVSVCAHPCARVYLCVGGPRACVRAGKCVRARASAGAVRRARAGRGYAMGYGVKGPREAEAHPGAAKLAESSPRRSQGAAAREGHLLRDLVWWVSLPGGSRTPRQAGPARIPGGGGGGRGVFTASGAGPRESGPASGDRIDEAQWGRWWWWWGGIELDELLRPAPPHPPPPL